MPLSTNIVKYQHSIGGVVSPFPYQAISWEIKETETYGYVMTGLWSSPDDWIKYLQIQISLPIDLEYS